MITVVGGIKGGTGKTTIATNLTVIRAAEGKKVLLIDTDEQRSSARWSQQRELDGIYTPWFTIQLAGDAVRSQILKLAPDFDDVIIDAGGKDSIGQRAALTVADYFIIPFQPSSLDVWTLSDIRRLLQEVHPINEKLKAYALINRGDFIGTDNHDAIEILQDCPNLECFPFVIGQRKAFRNAATFSLGVVEMKNQDKKAMNEILMLYDSIYQNDVKVMSKRA